jgi:TonB-dependent receptor-like protein/carboxypeptidase family protein
MRSTRGTSAAVGGLVLLCLSSIASAQGTPQLQPVAHIASVATGAIEGNVLDERGAPVAGAMVSALGTTRAFAVSDRSGHFELSMLSPGPYLLRAHLAGFVASRGQVVEVRSSARASSSIAMRRAATSSVGPAPILAAGMGPAAEGAPTSASEPIDDTSGTSSTGNDDHSEMAWRLRHVRRGILKDATVPDEILAGDTPQTDGANGALARAVGSPARLATNFFAGTPFSGQVNLLTTGSFESPQQLFSSDNLSRSTAFLEIGAPVGDSADWIMRAALTQGDLPSWIVSGEYTTRMAARHRYDIGLAYSTQRYDGGNFAALRSVTDGSRNAGTIYGFDAFAITPAITLSYGGRYARYDYLGDRNLISPRVALTLEAADHFRISGELSRRALAPGAEEFMPTLASGIWLPPQRTFSSLTGEPLEAERTDHAAVAIEHDLGSTTVSLRAYKQHVDDQLVTLFGLDTQNAPAALGHYFVGNLGDVSASGVSAGLRATLAGRVHGSVDYTVSRARFGPSDADAYLLLLEPSVVRSETQHVHDITAAIETDVPETATHVVVLYRVSNAFAHSTAASAIIGASSVVPAAADTRPAIDSRFDVQVRQSLPFMDFSAAKWEMLIGVRNFFHDAAPDQSVYDELLVVRPPKRIVGGLTLKF